MWMDGQPFTRSMRSLLNIKGSKEAPNEVNVEGMLNPVVDIAMGGFGRSEYKVVNPNSLAAATVDISGGSEKFIEIIGPTGLLNNDGKDTRILALQVQVQLAAGSPIGDFLSCQYYLHDKNLAWYTLIYHYNRMYSIHPAGAPALYPLGMFAPSVNRDRLEIFEQAFMGAESYAGIVPENEKFELRVFMESGGLMPANSVAVVNLFAVQVPKGCQLPR